MTDDNFQAAAGTVDMDERNMDSLMGLIQENARILDAIVRALIRIEKHLKKIDSGFDSECIGD